MKKGTSTANLVPVVQALKDAGYDLALNTTRQLALDKYNDIFAVASENTKLSNMREEILLENIEGGQTIFVDGDGNGLDFIRATILGNRIKFDCVQQKGNSGSMNAGGSKNQLNSFKTFEAENKITQYFNRFEDKYNPFLSEMNYDVELFLGFFLICDGTHTWKKDYKVYGGNDYLRKMGVNKSIVQLEIEVSNRVESNTYDAGAKNFNEVYNELITLI